MVTGQIKDTNTPYLIDMLREAGYEASAGPVLEDRRTAIMRAFEEAVEKAYGLIVTTGGVGAEGKDQTVEALLALAPDASAPYVLKFKRAGGTSREGRSSPRSRPMGTDPDRMPARPS